MRRIRWKTSDNSPSPIITLFLLFILVLTVPASLHGQDFEEFAYEPEPFPLPLTVDGAPVGDVNAVPREELDTEVDARELLQLLEGRVADDKLQPLRDWPDQWVTIEETQQFPFSVSFNMFDLIIEVRVPAESTISRDISLAGRRDPITYEVLEPSDFSFFTNIYSSFTFGDYDEYENNEVRSTQSAQLNIYPTLQFYGWAFDSRFTLSNTSQDLLTAGAMQLTKDWVDIPLRLMAGDISYRTATNQSGGSYFGLVLSQDRSKSFERQTYSDFTYEFLVPEDNALVSVLMNGRSIRRERLDANIYTLKDFYFNSGVNTFEIEITHEEEISSEEFLFAYDSRLTPKGQGEFTAGFGFRNFRDNRFEELPELFGMQLFGISPRTSGEYFIQAGTNQQNAGTSLIRATNLGNFKVSGAFSLVSLDTFGFYTSINYRYARPISQVNRSFSMTGSYQSPSYASFSNTDTVTEAAPSEDTTWRLSASYSQTLFGSVGFSANTNVSLHRDNTLDAVTFNTNLSRRLTRTFSVNARLGGTYNPDLEEVWSPTLTVSANITPRNREISANVQQSFTDAANTVALRYTPEQLGGDAAFTLNASNMTPESALPDSFSIGGSYNHRDFTFSAENRINTGSGTNSYITSFNINTAISYAGGLVGISRPISDSFVLVAPKQQVDGYVLGINPSGDRYTGRTDERGAAVVYNLSSFSHHNIVIEAIELPDGFEMGTDRYTYSPTLNQGAALKLGVESNVTVVGTMEFSDGTPVALYPGEFTHADADPGAEPGYFFTYTDGTYELYGLRSGDYTVTLLMGDGITFNLTVPEGMTGIINAKKIIIPAEYKVF